MFRAMIVLPSTHYGEPTQDHEMIRDDGNDLDKLIQNILPTFWEDNRPNVVIIQDENSLIRAIMTPGSKLNETHGEVHIYFPLSHLDNKTHEVWAVEYKSSGISIMDIRVEKLAG